VLASLPPEGASRAQVAAAIRSAAAMLAQVADAAIRALRAEARASAATQVDEEIAEFAQILGEDPIPNPAPDNRQEDVAASETAGRSLSAAWAGAALAALSQWSRPNRRTGSLHSAISQTLSAIDYRVQRTVTSEAARARNDEHRERWRALVKATPRGRTWGRTAFRRWDARLDRRVCAVCRRHESEECPVDGSFSQGHEPGEVHPGCRCIATTIALPGDRAEVVGVNNVSPAPRIEPSSARTTPNPWRRVRVPRQRVDRGPVPRRAAATPVTQTPAKRAAPDVARPAAKPKPKANPATPVKAPTSAPAASAAKPTLSPLEAELDKLGLKKGVHYREFAADEHVTPKQVRQIVSVLRPDEIKLLEKEPLARIAISDNEPEFLANPKMGGSYKTMKDGRRELCVRSTLPKDRFGKSYPDDAVPQTISGMASSESLSQRRIFLHEFAHHIHTSASGPVRSAIDAKIKEAFASGVAPSKYARVSPEEFFAESYSARRHESSAARMRRIKRAVDMVEDVMRMRGLSAD